MLSKSLVTSLRVNDRCTHSTVIKLHMYCCSPFSIIEKQNDPAAASHLSVSGVVVQCSSCLSERGDLDYTKVLSESRLCTIFVAVLTFEVLHHLHLNQQTCASWPSVVPLQQQFSFFVAVDPVFVSLRVLVVKLNGRSLNFVDPRLLNFLSCEDEGGSVRSRDLDLSSLLERPLCSADMVVS